MTLEQGLEYALRIFTVPEHPSPGFRSIQYPVGVEALRQLLKIPYRRCSPEEQAAIRRLRKAIFEYDDHMKSLRKGKNMDTVLTEDYRRILTLGHTLYSIVLPRNRVVIYEDVFGI